jgi:acyl-CoA thioesterase
MKTFRDVLDVTRLDETTFRLDVPDGWQQGRGAYGGLVIGAMVRAAMAFVGDETRRVRSVQAECLAPVPVGPAMVCVEPVRVSSSLAVVRVSVRLADDPSKAASAETLFHGAVLCARARPEVPAWSRSVVPPMPPVASLAALPVDVTAMPVFTQHFEYRLAGPAPYGASSEARAEGYVRARRAGERIDAAMIAALADCYWPAVISTFSEVRPIATISFALALHDDRLEPHEPVYHRAVCNELHDGYAHETRELWSPDGRLLATNQQVVAVIR